MEILATILNYFGLALCVASLLVKGEKMKWTLALVLVANASVGLSYLLGGAGLNGSAACFFGAIQAFINYFFDSKNKPIPKWLVAIYIVAIIALNIWVAGGVTWLGLLIIVASITFVMGIIQKNGKMFRVWSLSNSFLWCVYDLLVKEYDIFTTHLVLLIFAVVGMIIHDRKVKEKVE
jgi:hypothetical protein